MQFAVVRYSLKQFDYSVERLRSAGLQTFGEGVDDALSVKSG